VGREAERIEKLVRLKNKKFHDSMKQAGELFKQRHPEYFARKGKRNAKDTSGTGGS
jgi:hypothetical protein